MHLTSHRSAARSPDPATRAFFKVYHKLMRVLASLAMVTSLTAAYGQSPVPAARIDEWHGLKLGVTAPEEALQILGKPDTDDKKASGQFNPLWGESGLYSQALEGTNERLRKVLYYKRPVEGFKSVELLFFRGKLVLIGLEPKSSIPVSELQATYRLDFAFWDLSRYDQLLTPLQSDDAPMRIEAVDSSIALRTFYVVASRDSNVFGAFASTISTAQGGFANHLFLVSRDYLRPKQENRPKTETLLK